SEAIERQGLHLEIIGHEKEVGLLEQALNRAEGANAVLVGEPGVGKRTTVLGLAEKLNSGNTLPNLAHKHVVELNVDLLISGLSGPGEFTQRITQVFSQAANAGNIIIYIEGMEKILSSGEAGQIDATPVLMPYLGYPDVNIIGTINISDYNNLIAPNAALSQKIEKIEVAEPTDDEMIRILEDIVPWIENHFRTIVTYGAIKETIKLAKKYVLDQPNPEKSISVLKGAANTLNKTADKVITAEIIDNYVSSKTNIPVKEATGNEREVLINLEAELHKRVVNQTEAVNKVAGALRRSRTGVTDSAKPIGSFLFLGPTGVGKTETAKSLAAVYFGQEDAMIRFDMSEYQNKEDVYRLIGSPTGYGEKIEGELTSQVRNRPFSLILFDEIEKANPDILNLFLQILDEGFITSSAGRKVYFKNSIIIATSNAGANLIRQLVEKNTPYEQAQKQVIDFVQNEGIFKPELINRFTSVVYYTPLSKEHIKEVAKLMIRKLATDIATTKGVKLKVEIKALAKLSEMGYDPEMGARPMARVIQDQIENFLANKILRGEAKKGDEVIFRAVDIK
ncbi:MAG: ATP-dependent Clp protease ATP-binding subunit, partial [Patescibacteria group bacterium]|nr:ATP-dependent Clp protease ATP-binding subunit [Patescibacteria group bacterium]